MKYIEICHKCQIIAITTIHLCKRLNRTNNHYSKNTAKTLQKYR